MQLVTILLIIVGALTLMSGVVTFVGSSRADRVKSFWYLLTTFFITTWMASVGQFATIGADQPGLAEFHAQWGFVSVVLVDAFFLGYAAWRGRYGKVITLSVIVLALILSLVLFTFPHEFYSGITLSNTGNAIDIKFGPLCFVYVGYFSTVVPLILWSFWRQHIQTRSTSKRKSNLIMLFGFGISSSVVMLVNMILPLQGNWNVTWMGPLAVAVMILIIYYMILKYRELNLSSGWLRVLSYMVVITSIAIVYIIIFAVIFAALFRGSTPSTEVIVLNFIMILIFIALTPAMDGLLQFIRALISEQDPKAAKKTAKLSASHDAPKAPATKSKAAIPSKKVEGPKRK